MLLAIDTGNTNTLFAICDMDGSWVFEWRIATNSTRTADEYAVSVSYTHLTLPTKA